MDTALPPLVTHLLQPESYPHPVKTPIELIQTHVSYVFLTGDRVYKLKKPVNFGFLDYSTLEKRQEFCDRELELNRRSAADLYLGVAPIVRQGERYHLLAIGELPGDLDVTDYLVVMQQFPQAGLFSKLFDEGKLTESHLIELARVLASFHQTAPTSDYISAFGQPDRVKIAFDENFEQTEGFIATDDQPGPQTRAQFEATQAWAEAFFSNHADWLQARVNEGWIRNCHGDPHLGNICLWNDRVTLFDCIEFNEPFRFVDVMYDVAFVAMDLDARDRPDLATLFINEYVERTGDWSGLAVFGLYINRQTYVRAKVTSFLLNDPTVPAPDRQAAFDRAARYYRQAYDYTQAQSGRLFLTCGLSGSGKTTTARQWVKRLAAEGQRAIHIRSDAVRKHLGGVPLDERGPQSLYSPEMSQKTYDRLLSLGVFLAQQGYAVILDAKYDRRALRQTAIAAAQAAGLPLQILHCTAPPEVLKERLNARQGDIADATADLLAAQQAAFEDFLPEEQAYLQTV